MKEQLRMMEEFHRAFGHPIGIRDVITNAQTIEAGRIAIDFVSLREKLHNEECKELNEELWNSLGEEKVLPDILKEGADVLYVLLGTFVGLGLGDQLIEAFKRVHESNMSKLGEDGKPIYREDGKVMKGPNYKPPVLDDLV